MAWFETWFKNDLAKPINVVQLQGVMFNLDNLANKIGVELEYNGQPAALEGTIAGYVIRNDGTTLNLTTNTGKDGNRAWVILPQEAYTVEGPISIVIKLVYNSAETTIGACAGYVTRSRTSSEIAPTGTVIPSLASLEAAIAAANAAAANAADAADYIAPTEEDSTASAAHAVGSYFIYNGKLMKATSAIAQGATIVPYASGVTNYNCAEVPNGLSGDVYSVTNTANVAANNAADAQQLVAPVESMAGMPTSVATMAHATGSYFVYGGVLYEATADIAIGDTLATTGAGANATQVPGGIGGAVSELKSAIDQTNQNLSKIYDNGQLLTITQSAMLHPTGDGTITIDSNRNISYQENTNQSNTIGFSFASVIGKQYTASCNISMQSGNVSFSAVKGTTYSSTTFLAKEIIESSGTYSINFTATTGTTTIWFYFTSDVNSASVSELLCTSGWGYKGLDTAFTSENRPAQGKAVGNVRDRVGALEIKMNSIIDDENLITVDTETVLHTAGDSIIAITDNNGFTSTNSGNTNNLIGLAFTTQAQKQYTIKFKVSAGTVNSCFLCKTETYNSSNYIMTWATLVDAAIEYTFTAITGTTSIWFNQKYNMPVITVEDFYCSDGILRYKHDMMDYQGNEIITFNKILCIGDSITEGTFNYTSGGSLNNVFADAKYSYPTYLKAMTGREVYNHGHGGYTAKQWYDTYGNTDLSGYDACIIMLGINDGVQEVGVEQFSTNMTNIINKVMADNDGIKVFVATIVPAYSDYNRRFDDYIAETRRLVEEDFTGAFLVDINKYSVCKYYTYYEHGHLTAIGYQQLAKEFFTLISYIMHNDLEAFKGIQFIGTNYEW